MGNGDVGFSIADQLLSRSSVRLRALALETARAEVHQTFSAGQASGQPRGEGSSWQPWHNAITRYRTALDAMYPPLWQTLKDRLRSGDPEAVEAALVFLEADPMCFGSGYDKDTVMRRLSHLDLSEKARRRLRNVVVHTLQQPRRRECRALVLLGAMLWGPELERDLQALEEAGNDHVRQQVADLRALAADHLRRGR